MRKVLFYILCSVFQDLVAHLKELHATIMCHGTTVEKHCYRYYVRMYRVYQGFRLD